MQSNKYTLVITKQYEKKQDKWLSRQRPLLREKYYATLEMLALNPFYNSLRLHKLSGELSKLYSVSIDLKNRIIIDLIIENKKIILVNIGDHSIYLDK